MPNCIIKYCKSRSALKNKTSHSISYHRFPTDPTVKEAWIDATGQGENWFPTKTSCVCSEHFEETQYQVTNKARRLFPWAVPKLKTELVYKEDLITSTSKVIPKPIQPTVDIAITDDSSGTTKISEVITDESDKPPPIAKPKANVKVLLERESIMIKNQKIKIKRLQKMVQRYKKKYLEMKSIVEELRGKSSTKRPRKTTEHKMTYDQLVAATLSTD